MRSRIRLGARTPSEVGLHIPRSSARHYHSFERCQYLYKTVLSLCLYSVLDLEIQNSHNCIFKVLGHSNATRSARIRIPKPFPEVQPRAPFQYGRAFRNYVEKPQRKVLAGMCQAAMCMASSRVGFVISTRHPSSPRVKISLGSIDI